MHEETKSHFVQYYLQYIINNQHISVKIKHAAISCK